MMLNCAPIIIVTLNRYVFFKNLVDSLILNPLAKETDLYIGLDYPPEDKYIEGWSKIKDYIYNIPQLSFRTINVIEHKSNLGPRENIRYLVKTVSEKYSRWIFFEDDNIVSPNYLEYMNKCFEKYDNDPDVVAIDGYTYPVEWSVSEGATCLKQNVNFSMWGVGLWKEKNFEIRDFLEKDLLRKSYNRVIKEKIYKKMIDVAQSNYVIASCEFNVRRKKNDCWQNGNDFVNRCYLAVAGKYVITPVISKVRNVGFDGSGTCCQLIDKYDNKTASTYDYNNQLIDTSYTFELVEDNLHNDFVNRNILSAFDMRSPEYMKKTHRLIHLSEKYGCWSAKFFARCVQPYGLLRLLCHRISRTIK